MQQGVALTLKISGRVGNYKIKEFGLAFSVRIRYNDNCFRDVAQVVERYFREVEVASSSLVIPIIEKP